MQDDNTHMDQFFRESLKGLHQKPPAHAWERLKEDLLMARRRRRIVMYRWTAAAAALLLAFIAGYYLATFNLEQQVKDNTTAQSPASTSGIASGSEGQQNNLPVGTDSGTTLQNTRIPADQSTRTLPNVKDQVVVAKAAELSVQQEITQELQQKSVTAIVTPSEEVTGIISTPTPEEESGIALISPQEQKSPTEEQPGQKQITPEPLPIFDRTDYTESINTGSRWSAGGSFAPVYAYRSISIQAEELPPDINPDENYYNTLEDAMYSYSGGLDVIYHMQEKWEFQTGLYLSNLGHINKEVVAFEVPGIKDLLKVSSSTGVINIIPTKLPEEFVDNSIRRDSLTDAVYINSNIYQSFTYLELPLLIRYKLMDKRLGLHLTGGLSPGIMTDNNAHFTYEGQTIDLAREGEFYSMIYNSVVGAGIRYNISGSLSISLDPTFKYSLNSIRKDHSIEYHPYSISVFTGIRYSF